MTVAVAPAASIYTQLATMTDRDLASQYLADLRSRNNDGTRRIAAEIKHRGIAWMAFLFLVDDVAQV